VRITRRCPGLAAPNRLDERSAGERRLLRQHIEPGGGEPALLEGGAQRIEVDDRPAAPC